LLEDESMLTSSVQVIIKASDDALKASGEFRDLKADDPEPTE